MNRTYRGMMIAAAMAMAGPTAAWAQTPPPGAIFNLQVSHPGNLSTYELFSVNFVAAVSNTTVSFAFREVPAFFGFDNVSVTTGVGPNLLADPGFESATDGQLIPTGWSRWIQPIDVSAIGQVASTANPYGCSNYGPQSGIEFWCDGSVEGYDAVYQVLPTSIGATYTISWYLSDNSRRFTNDPEINMLAYATDGLPGGTIQVPDTTVPEPATMTLVATGLVGMAGFARRRRRSA